MIKGLNHVGLSVRNLERSIEFYCGAFGLDVVFSGAFEGERYQRIMALAGAKGRAALLKRGEMCVELFEFAAPDPVMQLPDRPVCDHGITHFCIEVDDIAAEYERLKAIGITFHCPPLTFPNGGNKATYGRDPDGNVFELWERGDGR